MSTAKSNTNLISLANEAILRELRYGSREYVQADSLPVTLKLYKQAQALTRGSSLVACVPSTMSKIDDLLYVDTTSLTDDSLVLFQLDCHAVANSANMQGIMSKANSRQVIVRETIILAIDSNNVYVLGQDSENQDVSVFDATIGNKWLSLRVTRLLEKGKRTQWKKVTDESGLVSFVTTD